MSRSLTILFLSLMLLVGCSGDVKKFRIQGLVKSDVDLVTDLHRDRTLQLLQQLMVKLYRRNPAQLQRQPGASVRSRWRQLQSASTGATQFDELSGARGIAAMHLAFSAGFDGDRVFALTAGLSDMLGESYLYKKEFYWLDSLDQQKLYNSARNIEVLVWMLHSKVDSEGRPLLLADSIHEDQVNLSFERLFGKLIAHQDMLALVVAGRTQRTINTVAQGLVSMTFIPL